MGECLYEHDTGTVKAVKLGFLLFLEKMKVSVAEHPER